MGIETLRKEKDEARQEADKNRELFLREKERVLEINAKEHFLQRENLKEKWDNQNYNNRNQRSVDSLLEESLQSDTKLLMVGGHLLEEQKKRRKAEEGREEERQMQRISVKDIKNK